MMRMAFAAALPFCLAGLTLPSVNVKIFLPGVSADYLPSQPSTGTIVAIIFVMGFAAVAAIAELMFPPKI